MTDKAEDRGDDVDQAALDAAAAERAEATERAEAAAAKTKADEEAAAAAAAAADKDEDKDKAKDLTIPKSRFDEAVKKERELAAKAEARAKELEDKLKAQEDGVDAKKIEDEIGALEDKLDQAIADGDVEKKKELRTQIRAKVQELARSEASRQAAYASAVAVERVRYDAALSAMEAAHPEINPDDDKFSQETLDEVVELKNAYEAAGMGSADALKRAAKYVFKTAPAEVKKEAEDKDKGKTAEEKAAAAEAAVKAKEEAIRRGAAAKASQPAADADKAGKASDKAGAKHSAADVARMTDKEFAKLDDNELRRARGDIL